MTSLNKNIVFEQAPNIKIDTNEVFGVQCEFIVQGFNEKNDYVPKIEEKEDDEPKRIIPKNDNKQKSLFEF